MLPVTAVAARLGRRTGRGRDVLLDGPREGRPVVRHGLGELEEFGRQVFRAEELDPQFTGAKRDVDR